MFKEVKEKLEKQLAKMVENNAVLFQVSVDRDKIWDVYLNAFSAEHRQGNNCNCCKSFLRQYGGIVSIVDNKLVSLWDFELESEEYENAIKALKKYVHSLPIDSIFLADSENLGVTKNFDPKRDLFWEHFAVKAPTRFVIRKNTVSIAARCGEARTNKEVLERSIKEISEDAVNTVIELIGQNSLYRGSEFLELVKAFSNVKQKFKKLKQFERQNFLWKESVATSGAVARIKNSAIGTLLNDLSAGEDLDKAVRAYERVVAPANYKRPTALVTPKMIDAAKKRLEELGLIGALERKILSARDLHPDNVLYLYRPKKAIKDVFEQLKEEKSVNPKSLSKVEEVTAEDFVTKILPTAKSVSILLENRQFGNFVTLVGPQNNDAKNMFKWKNNISWSYSGEVADSIKERVKNAGGKVDGILRISLSWSNYDDLDLHLFEPNGYEICFRNKRTISPTGGMLDVDMNAGMGTTVTPVENIFWTKNPKIEGTYKIVVHQFSRRDQANTGFELEIEYDGELYSWSVPENGATGKSHSVVSFKFDKQNGLKIDQETAKGYNSREKWGLKSGVLHRVKAATFSPNFWNDKTGNKHYFFFLEKCVADEKIRPFYNEFLDQSLDKDRKVFELLGSKVQIEPAEDELSGLGFSSTMRNHAYFEVEGAFKRMIKVNF